MKIYVTQVQIPAMSTLGYGDGFGFGECGQMFRVRFAGDPRLMAVLGEAVEQSGIDNTEPPVADVPEWAVISVQHVPEARA